MIITFTKLKVKANSFGNKMATPQILFNQWPESSALDNAADFCLATLPMALPPKNFLLKIA